MRSCYVWCLVCLYNSALKPVKIQWTFVWVLTECCGSYYLVYVCLFVCLLACYTTEEPAVGDDQLGVQREGAVDQVYDQLLCLLPAQRQAGDHRHILASPDVLLHQGDHFQGNVSCGRLTPATRSARRTARILSHRKVLSWHTTHVFRIFGSVNIAFNRLD